MRCVSKYRTRTSRSVYAQHRNMTACPGSWFQGARPPVGGCERTPLGLRAPSSAVLLPPNQQSAPVLSIFTKLTRHCSLAAPQGETRSPCTSPSGAHSVEGAQKTIRAARLPSTPHTHIRIRISHLTHPPSRGAVARSSSAGWVEEEVPQG
jgi:hypothetical protein